MAFITCNLSLWSPDSRREIDARDCSFHSWRQTSWRAGMRKQVGRGKGLVAAGRGAKDAGVGFLPACSLSLLCPCFSASPWPLPCFLSAGPHPRPLPARLQQQSLLHNVLHALLASTPPPSQRHAAFSPAPFPAVHEAAEELQPARYLCTWGVVVGGGVGLEPEPGPGQSALKGNGLKACG